MKNAFHLVLFFITAVFLTGCASTNMPADGDASLAGLRTILENAQPDAYETTRLRVVETFSAIEQQQVMRASSPAAKVKKVITTTGVILGLGGTISSFIIKNEDTKASIAQASSVVGGLTGIVSLIPFGSGAGKAQTIQGYLDAELSAFQERWPEKGELDEAQFAQFLGDSARMVKMVELLNQ